MHVYGFGSVCRGEVDPDSDVDLLMIEGSHQSRVDPDVYSIYSYDRIEELWRQGNPFAWHLSLESRLLFASDRQDYLHTLGKPAPYTHCIRDCEGFLELFCAARASIADGVASRVFDLSTIFLSIRNIATCFSLGVTKRPDFSRSSALRLGPDSVPISRESYQVLERARLLCTRGRGVNITVEECHDTMCELDEVLNWVRKVVEKAKEHERIQQSHCSSEAYTSASEP
jgi:hypothetical protein